MTIGDMLEILKTFANCKIEHVVDPSLLRPSDVTLQIPDTSKFRSVTGWEAEKSLETTMYDLLQYHRDKIRSRREF